MHDVQYFDWSAKTNHALLNESVQPPIFEIYEMSGCEVGEAKYLRANIMRYVRYIEPLVETGRKKEGNARGTLSKTYHFQGPDPPNPYLQFTLDAIDVVQLHALPPTSSGRFAPEKEELLRHAHRAAVAEAFVAFDVRAEPR